MNIKFLTFVLAVIGVCNLSTVVNAAEEQDFTIQKICKGTIAQIMGRSPKIITSNLESNGIVSLYYIREDDGTKWAYRCRIEGNTIVWANETGRWRNNILDSKIKYIVLDGVLYIEEIFDDGSLNKGQYELSELN